MSTSHAVYSFSRKRNIPFVLIVFCKCAPLSRESAAPSFRRGVFVKAIWNHASLSHRWLRKSAPSFFGWKELLKVHNSGQAFLAKTRFRQDVGDELKSNARAGIVRGAGGHCKGGRGLLWYCCYHDGDDADNHDRHGHAHHHHLHHDRMSCQLIVFYYKLSNI